MSKVEEFVRKHGAVRRDTNYANDLVGTSYNTVGLGDDFTSYSVIGEHSQCSQEWLDANPVTPWEELTEFERETLTREVIATINPDLELVEAQ